MNFLYDDAARMYERKAKRNDYKRLDNNVYLYQHTLGGVTYYTVKLFSTTIVEIYPDRQDLHPGSWHTMRTAKEIVAWSAAKGAYLSKGELRISHQSLKNGSCPLGDGLRIDNTGMPFTEDILSDWVQRVKPEVVRAWKQLTMPITKALQPRFALGEFNVDDEDASTDPDFAVEAHLAALERMDKRFPEHDTVRGILGLVAVYTSKRWGPRDYRTPAEQWRTALNMLRPLYYLHNGGYIQVEVPNV
jgi:hypothetical protein